MESIVVLLVIIAFYEVYQRVLKPVMGNSSVDAEVKKVLSRLSEKEYTVLDEAYGYLIVSVYGIFVLNVKKYTGWITGNETGDKWTQTAKESIQFDNPLSENEKVMDNIKKILKEKYVPMFSVVVFPDNTRLHIEAFHASVIKCSSLQNEIQRLSANAVMSTSQMKELTFSVKENINESEC